MSKPLKPIVKQRNANVRELIKKAKKVTINKVTEKVAKEAIYIGNNPLTGEKLYR